MSVQKWNESPRLSTPPWCKRRPSWRLPP